MEIWTSAAPLVGLGGLLCSLLLYFYIKKYPAGTPEMVEISEAIHEGAMTFLKREYTILAGFIVIVFVLLFHFVGSHTAYAFFVGSRLLHFGRLYWHEGSLSRQCAHRPSR
jgi:K(+)-stimulated pyrophosphate-energized sodium pump